MKKETVTVPGSIVNENFAAISKELAFVGSKTYKIATGDPRIPKERKYRAFLAWTLIKVIGRIVWSLRG